MQQVKDKERTRIEKLIRSIPKTEIHLHLEGLVSVDTLWYLINHNKLEFDGINTRQDLERQFNFNNLDEFIWFFINVLQNTFKTSEDLKCLISDAKSYLSRNNIVYAEIFFAPSKFLQNGLDFGEMMGILHEGAQKIKLEDNIEIKFIIDVSRTYGVENAEQNLALILENFNDSIIGIGLGGSESQGPAEQFATVFEKARKKGLKVVAHAGEDVDASSIWNSLKRLKAQRIGHGISAKDDPKLIEYLRKTWIPLEICPTSNVFTRKYVQRLQDHPIRLFFDSGVNVTLNTDDPTLFNIELVEEYYNLYHYLDFTLEELFQIMKNTLFATFLPDEKKEALWEKTATAIKRSGYLAP
ncbi:adenosine deaminase [Marispirochaeta aestuarii]|uniref:Adenosine deaminase n=1 Tax=Marispirochaeta aestuarii TaxID=1963862 RepID=A0A1Y1RWK6_9SPIO|nr:adenosine deaminase [Marispirochaeta aestuarii]ORC34604.1 adenosine deaminase [Marispirochaeta aestuarii]